MMDQPFVFSPVVEFDVVGSRLVGVEGKGEDNLEEVDAVV
jgi:hypothetical protein